MSQAATGKQRSTRRKVNRIPARPKAQAEAEAGPKRYKVICRGCKAAYLETNEKYDPDIPLRGYMLQMAEPYRSWMWSRPGSDHDLGPAIECPGCGNPLVQGNRDKPWLEEVEGE